jgi:3-deoxy-D-manno-octulosonic acid kinase
LVDAAHDPGRVLNPRSDPIGEVPPGYAVHRIGDAWLILDQKAAPELVPLQLADASARAALFARAPQRGRGPTPSVSLPDGSSLVLRRYRHGGLLGRLTGSLYLGPARALAELRVTAGAEQRGAPVPHVLCLVLWPILGPLWSAIIGTREERNAADLLTSLRDAETPAERNRLSRQAGDAVGRLHDAGVEHPDLQLRNVIVTPDSRVVIIDLDGAVFHRHGLLSVRKRAANLGRLARSAVKNGVFGDLLDRRDLAGFAAAYTRDRRDLRRQLRARIPLERWKLALHRLSYPLRRAG